MGDIGRNAPCPCGSGRKYKHCCLGKVEYARTETGRLAQSMHAAEDSLFDRIVAWVARRFGRGWADAALMELRPDAPPEEDDFHLLLPWLIYHHPLEGASPASHFLADSGTRLDDGGRETIECNMAAWLSMWEVRRVEPGVGAELFDVLSHETRFVHDVSASRVLPPWTVTLAFVVDYPGVCVLGGAHPRPLMPIEAKETLDRARRLLRVRTRPVPVERLRAPEVQIELIRIWIDAAADQLERAAAPVLLQNTDGDPIVLCTDHFDLAAGRGDELLERLAAIEGAERNEAEGGDEEIVFTRPGNSMHASWDNTIMGRAVLTGTRLRVESNSIARADALRSTIEHAAGDRVRHRIRDVRDAAPLLEEAPRERLAEPPRDPERLSLLREVIDRHWDRWIDSRIPALDGQTPRQAAAIPSMRPRLVALLKELEYHEASKPDTERFHVRKLWHTLGLE